MEPYFSLVFSFGLHGLLSDQLFDIVGKLPEEIGIMILRMLDPSTLLSAAMVSKKWLNLCHADSTLRKRILQQICLERKEYLNPFVLRIQRKHINNSCPLSTMNGNHRMTVSHVSNIVRPGLPRTWEPVARRFTVPAAEQPKGAIQRKRSSKLKSFNKASVPSIGKKMRM